MNGLIALLVLGVAALPAVAQERSERPFPGGADADLWVCAGQSNMAGGGMPVGRQRPEPGVMVYNMDGKWIPAVEPINRIFSATAPVIRDWLIKGWGQKGYDAQAAIDSKKPLGWIGPARFFARHLVKHTGRRIGLVPCSLGATSMADWSPARLAEGDHSLYGNMIQRIREVGGRVKGLIWYQGEGETSPGLQDPFDATWLRFVDSVRRDTGIADLPIIYVQIARYALDTDPNYGLAWERIRDKQRRLAAQRPNLYVVPAIDLPLDDLIHIGVAGHTRLGVRMAEVALGRVYGQQGRATAIDYASHEILPALGPLYHRMRVRFSGVNGRLTAAGRASGFSLRSPEPGKDGPMVFKVEIDRERPDSVILWYSKEIAKPVSLYYGAGLDPYANIVDSRDMAVPAFGPIPVEPVKPAAR